MDLKILSTTSDSSSKRLTRKRKREAASKLEAQLSDDDANDGDGSLLPTG
jgi:hypothetical protein